jgi:hypothetical protein
VRGKLKTAADFEHGKNVRNRRAFGKPLSSRKGVGNTAQTDAIVCVSAGLKDGWIAGEFIPESRRFGQ